jgi:uncharacterized protein (TIGR00369 family)
MTRSRTFTWTDPRIVRDNLQRLPGLEFLKRVLAGEFAPPPMAELMNIRIAEVERGRVVFEGTPAEYQYNPLGVIHGGMTATLLDSAMGCCVSSCLDAGDFYTTLELKVNYLRPLTLETGKVRAIATIVHIGRTTALAEGRVVDEQNRIYAYASSTCLVRRTSTADSSS